VHVDSGARFRIGDVRLFVILRALHSFLRIAHTNAAHNLDEYYELATIKAA